MARRDRYVMLISSLPSPEALFLARSPPLSRLKLDERLRVLTQRDKVALGQVERALNWRHLPLSSSESEVVDRARNVRNQVRSATVRQIVRDRLELRTCLAALRRRARGEKPPAPEVRWGVGRWVRHIARNWADPGFRLGNAFGWVRQADQLLRSGDAVGLERLVLDVSYRQLHRAARGHYFDFESVVIYVLKWNIVDRATRYNTEAARRRFDELLQTGLGRYADLTFERGA